MLALAIVLALIIGVTNIVNYHTVVAEADKTLRSIMHNEGKFPPPEKPDKMLPLYDTEPPHEMPYDSRFFTVKFSADGENAMVDITSISRISEENAKEMAEFILKYRGDSGFLDSYRFAVDSTADGTSVIFLECKRSLDNAHTFLLLSLLFSLAGLIAVFTLLLIFSDRIIKPVSDAYERQKQFITNAGHDIKTPLTIIGTDAELIELEIGENEWLADIKKQTKRLTELTSDLIYLSRMEEAERVPHIEFPICDVAEDVISSFAAPAKSKKIVIESDISSPLSCVGDEGAMRKLLTILMDNAIKYSPEGERVKFSLKKQGKSIAIRIENIADGLTAETLEHMFDRFYRSDLARSSSGGFGIGLSVASAIVASHKGKISAAKVKDSLIIDIVL